ncbi:MAG: glycoside hydrolase family 92 protein [Candidatus Latescibacteria bacterium]|jgi:predicted alpha-1,2-mannosidase|nr:glycoside hydrolase family 92 protein [Candidatus Latescibacterota bacterium]
MPQRDLIKYVNPEQGTASVHRFSNGNTLPLVTRPFSMTSWAPQTEESRRFYHPDARQFEGMRATRQPSPWIGDYGHFTIMPQSGRLFTSDGRRASIFRRDQTEIRPNYFRTYLGRYQTTLEMTPTERCAIFRFSFPQDQTSRVIIDSFEGESHIQIHPNQQTLTGYTRSNSGGVPEGFACYFYARFDRPIAGCGTFQSKETHEGEQQRTGERVGGYVELDGATVNMRIGTSFISIEQAKQNLESELGNRPFDVIRLETERLWQEMLNRVHIEDATETQNKTFYTSLYRSVLFPRFWHEYDQDNKQIHFSPYDGQIHPGPLVTDNGFWDTHRTVYSLLSILYPEHLTTIMQGWTNASKEGGWTPKWSSPGYRACMIGTHLDAVFADAYVKGICDFDIESAYQAMYKNATEVGDEAGNYGRRGIEEFDELGYVPADKIDHAASRTQDFAYNDYCVAQIAKALGKQDDYERFIKRASYYRNTFDPNVDFMRGRNTDDSWQDPFNEFAWGGAFIEGSAWQCGWAVPHDPAGLIERFGGKEKTVQKLNQMMSLPPIFDVGTYPTEIHEMTEMAAVDFGQYAHSNQPVHHVLYLYACAGKPSKTQYWVRRVLNELYSSDPDGFAGDEDNGEMSAWYIFNALGFYPFCPGHPSYILGSPLFKSATLFLANDKTFTINAPENSADNVYAQNIQLNNQTLNRADITQENITTGGILSFTMTNKPHDPNWSDEELPYSLSHEK